MNPFVCTSLAFLLTVSQAVSVAAKGKKKSKSSSTKSGSKSGKSIPVALIAGVVGAIVVVLLIIALIIFIKKRSGKLKKMNDPAQPQGMPYTVGGQDTNSEKGGYSPYIPTLPNAPPPAPYNQGEWRQDVPPPQFAPSPAFPAPQARA